MSLKPSLLERYKACMVLHAVGDAMGFRNNKWEFIFDGPTIHKQLKDLGGVDNLRLNPTEWRVSDDTVLHLATAECLMENHNIELKTYKNLIRHYKLAMQDMSQRAPGQTTINAVAMLDENRENGHRIPFNPRGAGCGASMRSSCIGLRFSKREQLNSLIEFSVESGRMTHHHPMGYLGATAVALLVSYAIQEVPLKAWGAQCLKDLEMAYKYVIESPHYPTKNKVNWESFINPWLKYLKLRNIENGVNEPEFPGKYGVEERDKAYEEFAGIKWPGSVGVDSVLIGYDGILGCDGDWRELCERAMLHGGDNDSTGCIAGSLYGAVYGFQGVDKRNYETSEYYERGLRCGEIIYKMQNE